MFLAILFLSFVLLMLVFRSMLVPLKAVIMNLLSIGAAYGVIVAIFQWGWVKDAIGIGKEGPIEAWVPMMLFAIVFGLSMDYEVFLLSRIKEEYDRTHDNADPNAKSGIDNSSKRSSPSCFKKLSNRVEFLDCMCRVLPNPNLLLRPGLAVILVATRKPE